ncbi:hypothetical protein BIV57_04380, partial [Mangrovactinospora gilvigrisea]
MGTAKRRGETRARMVAVQAAAGILRTEQEKAADRHRETAAAGGYRMAEIRRAMGLTQVEVAEAMGTVQHTVSRIEDGELTAAEVDTLRRYVEALGGRLRIVADFGDRQFD